MRVARHFMKGVNPRWRAAGRWSPALFFAAGGLLLVQVLLIGLRKYHIGSFSELWIAPPAIAALVAGLGGLIGLHSRLALHAPRLAGAGSGIALLAAGMLGVASAWIVGRAVLGGIPQPLPAWFLAMIAGFMIAFMLSFAVSGLAGLCGAGALRTIGCLLLAPVVSWSAILIVGFSTNFGDALKLDFYTNGIISLAFLAIGRVLGRRSEFAR